MKTKIILALVLSGAFISITNAQVWNTNGLNFGSSGNTFGTNDNFPIDIFTNGNNIAQFTTGASLGGFNPITGITLPSGDGLRIMPNTGYSNVSGIDMWTGQSGGATVHLRLNATALLQGTANRFEVIARRTGFWFNTQTDAILLGLPGRYLFNRGGTEMARVGMNNYWRIGLNFNGINGIGIDATRRLEVVDNVSQFRLRFSSATGTNLNIYSDFFTAPFGLNIMPMFNGGRSPLSIHRGGTTITQDMLVH